MAKLIFLCPFLNYSLPPGRKDFFLFEDGRLKAPKIIWYYTSRLSGCCSCCRRKTGQFTGREGNMYKMRHHILNRHEDKTQLLKNKLFPALILSFSPICLPDEKCNCSKILGLISKEN